MDFGKASRGRLEVRLGFFLGGGGESLGQREVIVPAVVIITGRDYLF